MKPAAATKQRLSKRAASDNPPCSSAAAIHARPPRAS
jgi:hypothetical protein